MQRLLVVDIESEFSLLVVWKFKKRAKEEALACFSFLSVLVSDCNTRCMQEKGHQALRLDPGAH